MINKLFNSLFARNQASYFQKKQLIVNSKKSIEKNVLYLDLSHYKYFNFFVEKENEIEAFLNNYKIVLEYQDLNSKYGSIDLGYFYSKDVADKELLDIQSKLYGRFSTVFSLWVKVVVLLAVASWSVNFVLEKTLVPNVNTNSNVSYVNPQVNKQIDPAALAQFLEVSKGNSDKETAQLMEQLTNGLSKHPLEEQFNNQENQNTQSLNDTPQVVEQVDYLSVPPANLGTNAANSILGN